MTLCSLFTWLHGYSIMGRPCNYLSNQYSHDIVLFIHILTELLYHGETLRLMINRWAKLVKDFKSKNGDFDISKIPDIYDCIKYDMLHNR